MQLEIGTRPRDDGQPGNDVVLVGDTAAFFWLIQAAGSARDGFRFNTCETAAGDRLVLEPAHPLPDDQQKKRSKTAHSNVRDERAPSQSALERLGAARPIAPATPTPPPEPAAEVERVREEIKKAAAKGETPQPPPQPAPHPTPAPPTPAEPTPTPPTS